MKLLVLVAFIFFSNSLWAQTDIDAMKISKGEIEKSLEMLKQSGTISEEDYKKAKTELGKMSDKEVDSIAVKAKEAIKKDPKGTGASDKEIEKFQQELEKISK